MLTRAGKLKIVQHRRARKRADTARSRLGRARKKWNCMSSRGERGLRSPPDACRRRGRKPGLISRFDIPNERCHRRRRRHRRGASRSRHANAEFALFISVSRPLDTVSRGTIHVTSRAAFYVTSDVCFNVYSPLRFADRLAGRSAGSVSGCKIEF